jgi:hypothetical protein
MKDFAAFEHEMQRMGAVYNRKIETLLLDTWWDVCGSLSDAQFASGCETAMKESLRFPTPAAVRAAAYAWKEEKDTTMEHDSGIPGVALLAPGPMVDAARREGVKYADNPITTPLFSCLLCRDRRHVRVEVMIGTPHFGRSIPCPRCHGDAYDRYTEKIGVPDGMPKWSGA